MHRSCSAWTDRQPRWLDRAEELEVLTGPIRWEPATVSATVPATVSNSNPKPGHNEFGSNHLPGQDRESQPSLARCPKTCQDGG